MLLALIRVCLGFCLATTLAVASELKIASLNCFLFFDPRIEHRGKLDNEHPLSLPQFHQKVANLASLIRGFDIVAVQEIGGRAELSALAAQADMHALWAQGRDTATGEEVGLLYQLPGWSLVSAARSPALDLILSKHLLVEFRRGDRRALFLVLHLIRPLGNQLPKHRQQIAAVASWMQQQHAADPAATIVVLGDTNSTVTARGSSLFGVGREAGEAVDFKPTHLNRSVYDRLVLLGPGAWRNVVIRPPPYGKNPPADLKRVWTDHFLLGAELVLVP
jgi:hypothetical protein